MFTAYVLVPLLDLAMDAGGDGGRAPARAFMDAFMVRMIVPGE